MIYELNQESRFDLNMNRVAIFKMVTEAAYPADVPFHPSDDYPEYPFPGRLSRSKNVVYEGVRKLFTLLNLDREHAGTAAGTHWPV